jgi:hypothetical protein
MSERSSKKLDRYPLVSLSEVASILDYDQTDLLILISQGEITLNVYCWVVPGTIFSVLKNHTKSQTPYPNFVKNKVYIEYHPDVYAVLLPREIIIELCQKERAECYFFPGGIAEIEESPVPLVCIDRNFLSGEWPPFYWRSVKLIKGETENSVSYAVPEREPFTNKQASWVTSGLVSPDWKKNLPLMIRERTVPIVHTKNFSQDQDQVSEMAEIRPGENKTVSYVMPHRQEIWLGVYGQRVTVTKNANVPLVGDSIVSPVKYPKFNYNDGYETPDPVKIEIDDLKLFFDDALELVESTFGKKTAEAKKGRKRIFDRTKKSNRAKKLSKAKSPGYVEEKVWAEAREKAVEYAQPFVGKPIGRNCFNELIHVIASAQVAWDETPKGETCDSDRVWNLLIRGNVLYESSIEGIRPLIRFEYGKKRNRYIKKDEQDPCVLNTRVRGILIVAEEIINEKSRQHTKPNDLKTFMRRKLKAKGIESDDAATALTPVLLPEQLFD